VSDDRVAPDALAVGRVYRDDEGLAWVALGRDGRGAVRLAPSARGDPRRLTGLAAPAYHQRRFI
jgi:hypothetical protein